MTTLIVLFIAGLSALLITWFVVDYSVLGLSMVLLASLLTQVMGVGHSLVGSIHFRPEDGIAALLMFAGILRFVSRRTPLNISSLLLLTYIGLFFFSLARGVVIFGIHDAGNESRPFFDVASCLLYFSTFPPTEARIKEYFRVYIVFAVLLVCTAGARLVGILPPNLADPARRPLPAMGAYSICLAFLICLCWQFYGSAPRYFRWLTPAFAAVAVALQHRTVWVVLLGLIAAIYKLERRILGRLVRVLITVAVLIVVIGPIVYGSRLDKELHHSATSTSTLVWRIQGWTDLIRSHDQTPITYAVGLPFGTGYTRYVEERVVNAGAHDDYVAEFLRVGFVGLIVLLLLLLRPMYLLYRRRKNLDGPYPHPLFWVLFTISILFWDLTYNLTIDQAAFIGILTSIMFHLSAPSHTFANSTPEYALPLFMRGKNPEAI
jgi:O-antigen ligase